MGRYKMEVKYPNNLNHRENMEIGKPYRKQKYLYFLIFGVFPVIYYSFKDYLVLIRTFGGII